MLATMGYPGVSTDPCLNFVCSFRLYNTITVWSLLGIEQVRTSSDHVVQHIVFLPHGQRQDPQSFPEEAEDPYVIKAVPLLVYGPSSTRGANLHRPVHLALWVGRIAASCRPLSRCD